MEKDELKEALECLYEVMGSKKLAQSIANCYWNTYQEFKTIGFTQEQALTLISRMNFGGSK